jgi:hypothetical protein
MSNEIKTLLVGNCLPLFFHLWIKKIPKSESKRHSKEQRIPRINKDYKDNEEYNWASQLNNESNESKSKQGKA